MKKLVLILAFLAGSYQLKAQQLLLPKFFDSLANSSKSNNYLVPGSSLKQLQIGPNLTALVNKNNFNSQLQSNNVPNNNMPVAKLEGNFKMPVVKLDGNSKMPIVNLNNQGQNLLATKYPDAVIVPVQKK